MVSMVAGRPVLVCVTTRWCAALTGRACGSRSPGGQPCWLSDHLDHSCSQMLSRLQVRCRKSGRASRRRQLAAAGRAHLGGQSLAQSGCAVREGCPAPLNEGEAQAGGQRHRGARWEACGRPGALPQLRQRYHRSIGRPRAAMGGQGGWEAKCAACPGWRRAHRACQIALTAGSIAADSCLQPARRCAECPPETLLVADPPA